MRGGGGKEAREACCAMLHAGKQAEAMREAEQLFSEGIFSQAELDCELVRISGAAQGRAVGRGGAEAMVAVAQTEGQDTMRASSLPGGAPGEAQVDYKTASLQLLERYLKLSKPPDSAFDSIGTERTRLSDQGRELVWLECRASLRAGSTKMPVGQKAKIAEKYSVSAKTVARIWSGKEMRGSSDAATQQLRDQLGHHGQGGIGAPQDADDGSAEAGDEEMEEETMAHDAGVSDSDFAHWRVYHIVCVFQMESV